MSNIKRIESCKQIGSLKKRLGHSIELKFREQYKCSNIDISYKATADNIMVDTKCEQICQKLNIPIKEKLNVSNKSGKNIQFTLGNIPELKDIDIKILSNKEYLLKIFNKYLKKEFSENPIDILVYYNLDNNKWLFFDVNDIISFIVNNCIWRRLKSGRIKGDFEDYSLKGKSQYITYEYRPKHKSYFLGLNCNRGLPFINLLLNNIECYIEDCL